MSNDYIYENDKYFIKIGESTHDEQSVRCYQVTNKETEVIEAEMTVLPTAIQYADNFAEGLEKVTKQEPKKLFEH